MDRVDKRWVDELERSMLPRGLGRAAAAVAECVAALPDVARVVLPLRRTQWRTLLHKIRGVVVRGSSGVGPAARKATFGDVLAERLGAPSPELPWHWLTDPVETLLKLAADVETTRGAPSAWQALWAFCETQNAATSARPGGRARQSTLWKAATMAYALDVLRYGEGDWVRAGRTLTAHGWTFPGITGKKSEEQLARVLQSGVRRWQQLERPTLAKPKPRPKQDRGDSRRGVAHPRRLRR